MGCHRKKKLLCFCVVVKKRKRKKVRFLRLPVRIRPRLAADQKSNNQSQAGSASQVILNLFLVQRDGKTWSVHPVTALADEHGNLTGPQGTGPVDAVTVGQRSLVKDTEVDVTGQEASNAQGQGLTVLNEANLADIIQRALAVAVPGDAQQTAAPATEAETSTREGEGDEHVA